MKIGASLFRNICQIFQSWQWSGCSWCKFLLFCGLNFAWTYELLINLRTPHQLTNFHQFTNFSSTYELGNCAATDRAAGKAQGYFYLNWLTINSSASFSLPIQNTNLELRHDLTGKNISGLTTFMVGKVNHCF